MEKRDWLGSINNKIKDYDSILKLVIAILGIIATILAAFYGASLGIQGSQDLWKKQNDLTKQNVGKALYIEISRYQPIYKQTSDDYKLEQLNFKENNILYPPKILRNQIYPNYLLYFTYQKEISSFSPRLSDLLFTYYTDLLSAEEYRKFIVENPHAIPTVYSPRGTSGYTCERVKNDPITSNYKSISEEECMLIYSYTDPYLSIEDNQKIFTAIIASNRMKNDIIEASEITPEILSLLKNESAQNP